MSESSISVHDFLFGPSTPENEVTYATGRLPSRTYVSRSFMTQFGQDAGHPGRYVYRVLDEVAMPDSDEWEWEYRVVASTPGGRKQIRLAIAREAGAVRKLKIQKVPTSGDLTRLEPVLELDRDQSKGLIDALRAIDVIPIEGEGAVRIDDELLHEVLADPAAASLAYAQDPDRFRALIEDDADADDVIAVRRRRAVVATMRSWLEDPDAFDAAITEHGGPEKAWQHLLEENPWILGVGLTGQLLTAWDSKRLEQVVVGRNIESVGKRADALLATAGVIRSAVFAEIKHHRTALVETSEYRPGCWGPSKELAGAVVQSQQTVELATRQLSEFVHSISDEGEELREGAHLLRPRSFVIAGTLKQLTGDSGGVLKDRFRSFELFRRNLYEPDVITFDELLARAEWSVNAAEADRDSDPHAAGSA